MELFLTTIQQFDDRLGRLEKKMESMQAEVKLDLPQIVKGEPVKNNIIKEDSMGFEHVDLNELELSNCVLKQQDQKPNTFEYLIDENSLQVPQDLLFPNILNQ